MDTSNKTSNSTQAAENTAFAVLLAVSFMHLSNDTLQSLIPAMYPLLKEGLALNFSQVGLITLVFQLCSSIFQPVIGWYTDKKPQPYSLPAGMAFSMIGVIMLSFAHTFPFVLFSVALTGLGSSVLHPEASRLAYMASGGKRGLAQSIFQVGGNFGSSLGPLLAALLIAPYGQGNLIWFAILALCCILLMVRVSRWYKTNLHRLKPAEKPKVAKHGSVDYLPKKTVYFALGILLVLIFSKYIYLCSITSYYTFYLIDKFGVSIQHSQYFLFLYLFAAAVGTFLGGPIGDRIGRKYVIWISILGVAPFTLAMPHLNLLWTVIFSVCIGFILSSAFSAILVYAQELMPGKVGLIAGFFFGFAFGVAGIGSAFLGKLADSTSIEHVYLICSFLPLIGLITAFLPNLKGRS
ncbi:MAG: MFS transporter [Candidatus Symbiothrix sp.]|jgi:FSR family fosmidomycin resistance protein-like MFS transporter|nr:MFS transporter [Candidatus Symbiothrix sp.]